MLTRSEKRSDKHHITLLHQQINCFITTKAAYCRTIPVKIFKVPVQLKNMFFLFPLLQLSVSSFTEQNSFTHLSATVESFSALTRDIATSFVVSQLWSSMQLRPYC